jgi:hypothetical protein
MVGIVKKGFGLLLILTFIGVVACNNKKGHNETETSNIADEQGIAYDSTKIEIDVAIVDSMLLLYPDSNNPYLIDEKDWTTIAGHLKDAQYDTDWNDRGMMVKMVAPDYTTIIGYKGKDAEENDWLMIWKDSGMAKFRNKWFLIVADKREALFSVFDSYRSK